MDSLVAGLLNAHSLWRYVVLMMGGIAIGRMLMGWIRQDPWQPLDQQLGRLFVNAVDVAVGLGLLLWLLEGRWQGADLLRSWRHPALMLVAVIAAHYGWRRVLRAPVDNTRFGWGLIFLGITGLILVVGVLQIRGVL
ncbi:MAG: hypothetical protein R3C14_40465 [Caldilineaceae bacterium]